MVLIETLPTTQAKVWDGGQMYFSPEQKERKCSAIWLINVLFFTNLKLLNIFLSLCEGYTNKINVS